MSNPLRFEGATIDEARQKVREHFGTDLSKLSVVRHGKERSGGVLGFFQREQFVIDVENCVPNAASLSKDISPSPQKRPNEGVVTDRLSSLLEKTVDTFSPSLSRELSGNESKYFDDELRDVLANANAVLKTTPTRPATFSAPNATTTAMPSTTVAPCAEPRRAATMPAPHERLDEEVSVLSRKPAFLNDRDKGSMADVCMPNRSSVALDGEDGLSLATRLAATWRQATLPDTKDAAVVLVGEVRETIDVARQVARRFDDDAAIVVVSHRRMTGDAASFTRARNPEEAGAIAVSRRIAGHKSVIIVDDSCREDFVTNTVAGVCPQVVWAVIAVSRSERNIKRIEKMLGRLDAIALYGTLDAERSDMVLDATLPIAYIDRWEATPLSLAARLLESKGRNR